MRFVISPSSSVSSDSVLVSISVNSSSMPLAKFIAKRKPTEKTNSTTATIIATQRFVVICILSLLFKILHESHLKYQLFSLHLHRLFFLSLASFQASQTEKGSFISVIFSTALLMHYWKILLACSYIYGHLSWKLYVVAAVFFVYQK